MEIHYPEHHQLSDRDLITYVNPRIWVQTFSSMPGGVPQYYLVYVCRQRSAEASDFEMIHKLHTPSWREAEAEHWRLVETLLEERMAYD